MSNLQNRILRLEKSIEPSEVFASEVTIHGKVNGRDYIIRKSQCINGEEKVLIDNTTEYQRLHKAESNDGQITQPKEITIPSVVEVSEEVNRLSIIEKNIESIKSGMFKAKPELKILISPPKEPPAKKKESKEVTSPRSELDYILNGY